MVVGRILDNPRQELNSKELVGENVVPNVFQTGRTESNILSEKLPYFCKIIPDDRLLRKPWQELTLNILEYKKFVSGVFRMVNENLKLNFGNCRNIA
ncbi:hypothetical protein TNCV_1475591 [Trichonephila clavipes]|nr:hypothetical protein TNCV_1475591 [Trichonephila clavipes]